MSTNPTNRVHVTCPHCGQGALVPRTNLGKQGRCPGCKQVFLLAELPPTPQPVHDELWSDLDSTREMQLQVEEPVVSSASRAVTSDYLARAKDEPYIKQEERQPYYRFMTSYGAVIGSTLLFMLGFGVFIFISIRVGILMMIPAGAGIVQGINYIFYYRYLDSEGR